jgi:hypothetical protein
MSEVVSVRLPLELFKLMVGEAESKGVSLSMLLREIVESTTASSPVSLLRSRSQ